MIEKKEILFPHDEIRETQDQVILQVTKALKNKQHLILNAPTGLGKTDATIPATLSFALKNNLTVFFLTPRHTQHKIAIESLIKIKERYNKDFLALDLIGKKWLCLQENVQTLNSSQFPEYCRNLKEKELCDFYNNFKRKKTWVKDFIKQVKDKNPLHVGQVFDLCSEEKYCPYEICLSLAKDAKIIIADYYHIFNKSIRENLFERTQKDLSDCIIIVDEAHNLPGRIRELLTKEISIYVISQAIKEAKSLNNQEAVEQLDSLNNILSNLAKEKMNIQDNEVLIKKIDLVKKIDYYEEVIENLEECAEAISETKKRSFAGSVSKFLRAWVGEDNGFARILSKGFSKSGQPFISLTYRCLDPAISTKEVVDNSHTTIMMSGTLSPTVMYQDLLGIDNPLLSEFKDPFPRDNRLNIVIPETTTKFTERNTTMYKKIAKSCANLVNSIPGNIAIFFPSYKLRDEINIYFQDLCSKTIFFEQQGLSKSEREETLERFKKYKNVGAVLLGANAGSYAEGIDLPGDLLKAVIVVGLPLAQPNLEIKELINYYDKKFQKGWDYGYIFPAIIKSLQAAGRCIRSEKDRGVIIFMDMRYAWPSYSRCFPKDWHIKITKEPEKLIKDFFK